MNEAAQTDRNPHSDWDDASNGKRNAKLIKDPLDNEHITRAWDAVAASDHRITDHISGASIDHSVSLAACVNMFHAASIKVTSPLYPEMLASLLGRFPGGAFADRAGCETFITEVRALWATASQRFADAAQAKNEARSLAATLFDPWGDLPPPAWPRGVLRPDYEATIAALAERDGCDAGALAMCYVMAISGAAQKDMRCAQTQSGVGFRRLAVKWVPAQV